MASVRFSHSARSCSSRSIGPNSSPPTSCVERPPAPLRNIFFRFGCTHLLATLPVAAHHAFPRGRIPERRCCPWICMSRRWPSSAAAGLRPVIGSDATRASPPDAAAWSLHQRPAHDGGLSCACTGPAGYERIQRHQCVAVCPLGLPVPRRGDAADIRGQPPGRPGNHRCARQSVAAVCDLHRLSGARRGATVRPARGRRRHPGRRAADHRRAAQHSASGLRLDHRLAAGCRASSAAWCSRW